MRTFYQQHNPAIVTNAPYIRVVHLRKDKGSLHLNDLNDLVQNHRTEYKVASYVPYGKTIDILMVDRALFSYQHGAIRNLMNKGFAAAFILTNRDIIQAEIGDIYAVNLTQSLVTVDTTSGAAFVTLPSGDLVPEGWQIEIKKTSLDANQIQINAGSYDIEGTGSLYVVDGPQEAVKLTYDGEGTWWVLTKAEGTASLTGRSLRDYIFANSFFIPSNTGILYMEADGVSTASVPLPINKAGTLKGASIQVNTPDPVRTYLVEVMVNASVVETVALPTSSVSASSTTFTTAITAGSLIALRVVRQTGTGKSSFNQVRVTLEMEES